jgi:hypothetical protein
VTVSSTLPAAGGPLHNAADASLHHNSFVEPHPEGGECAHPAAAVEGDTAAAAAADGGAGEASTSAAPSDSAAALLDDPVVKEVRLLASAPLNFRPGGSARVFRCLSCYCWPRVAPCNLKNRPCAAWPPAA